MTALLTEPRKIRRTSPRACVPITMRSMAASAA